MSELQERQSLLEGFRDILNDLIELNINLYSADEISETRYDKLGQRVVENAQHILRLTSDPQQEVQFQITFPYKDQLISLDLSVAINDLNEIEDMLSDDFEDDFDDDLDDFSGDDQTPDW